MEHQIIKPDTESCYVIPPFGDASYELKKGEVLRWDAATGKYVVVTPTK